MNPKKRRELAVFNVLDDLYATLPKLECKGLCHEICADGATFKWARVEEKRIASRLGGHMPKGNGQQCALLTQANRCRVYDIRPMICRLWGMVDHPLMRCPHGCEPARWLTSEEGWELLRRVQSGHPHPQR